MIEITGAYSTAKVFTDIMEESAAIQIETLCNQPFTQNSKIRIMPDVHAGAGCVIGFTANLGEMVIPNIVGVDIGCGMLTVDMGKDTFPFAQLDAAIRQHVPSGKMVHGGRMVRFPALAHLHCYRELKDTKRIARSIGTLGGGNHFIEVDTDDAGRQYLIIHTGSRNLGKQVADYYQNLSYSLLCGKDKLFAAQKVLIAEYKAAGRKLELTEAIKALRNNFKETETGIPKELCYVTGEYRQMYLHDMAICQEFATLNRKTIANILLHNLFGKFLKDYTHFETVHNYIDLTGNIVRKGAVSAKEGELLLIPVNMRDGSLICVGKGNEEWNCSAPHGAGRLFSRTKARELFSLQEFQESMQGVFTTSVGQQTLDECPMAYKGMEDIVKYIGPTAEIVKITKPVYNFKASE